MVIDLTKNLRKAFNTVCSDIVTGGISGYSLFNNKLSIYVLKKNHCISLGNEIN